MPIKRVQFPDGSVKRIEVPEGATNEQILAFVQSQHAEPAEWQPRKRSVEELRQGQGFDPAADMSGGQRFMAGMGKSLYDTGRGLLQLGGDVSDGAGRLLGRSGSDLSGSITGQSRADVRRAEVDQQRQVDAPLMATNGGMGGNIVGTVGQFLVPGGAALRYGSMAPKVAGAVRAATLPTSIRGAALQGSVVGATQQVGTDDSRLGNTALGGVAGSVGAAAPRAVGGLYRVLRGSGVTKTGAERRIAEILRSEASNPQALEVAAPSMIPGVQRTLAEETLDPGISRLERLLRSKTKGWDELDARNDGARREALRGFAGDDGAVAAAQAERDAMAEPFLRAAKKHTGVDLSRLDNQLTRAQDIYSGRPAVQSTLADVQGLLRRPASAAEKAASPNWPDEVLRDEVSQIYNVRKTLGDLMSGKLSGEKPAAQAATRELMMVRNGLDRAVAKETPMFQGYLEAYKQGSREVDRRKLGQYLLEKGAGSANSDALTPAGFNRMAGNLDAAAASATGFRKARADNILEPEDFATIGGVSDDLKRVYGRQTLGSGGNSQTFERFAGEGRLRSRIMQAIPLVRNAAQLLDDVARSRLERSLADVMQDPSKARAILAKLPEKERRIFENALSQSGGFGGAMTPALAE